MHTEKLPVILTETELAKNGEELGALEIQLVAVKESKKASAKQFADEITEIEQGIARHAKIATEGQEYRDVSVAWESDLLAGVKRLVRQDNGNEVRNVVLSDDERQYGLFPDPATDEEANADEADELGPLPDPETVVQDAIADDPDAEHSEATEEYDASHANGSGKG